MSPLALFASLLLSATPPTGYPLPCMYPDRFEQGAMEHAAHCAREEGEALVLAPAVRERLDFGTEALAPVAAGRGWHWVRPDGASAAVLTYDNGADDFIEGRTRGRGPDGLMRYYDSRLDLVLQTPYRWAEPYDHGRAIVCDDCRTERVDGGEHSIQVGTRWSAIDRDGRRLLPWQTSRLAVQAALDAQRR